MAYVKDIAGATLLPSGITVCLKCLTNEERQDLTENEVISRDEVDDDDEGMYFCDRCKKQL